MPILQDLFQKKLINIRTFIIIASIIACSWIVVLKLTQQRVQLEGLSALNNISQNVSPFKWDFIDYESDLVESSKSLWQENTENHSITSMAHTQPHLSLNFSSDVINSQIFDTLIIKFRNKPSTKLLIQFKTELDDDYFYYSPHINVTSKTMKIDMNHLKWQGLSDSNPAKAESWGTQLHKVSSLVLNFTDSPYPIVIDSIELPYKSSHMNVIESRIDCGGNLTGVSNINTSIINHLVLDEICLLPSNYMWLQREVSHLYPGSVLTLEGATTMDEPKLHRINHSYAYVFYINLVFYGWLVFVFIAILAMTKYASLLIKTKTFITVQFKLTPSFKSYGFVLLPSFVVFLMLNYLKPIDSNVIHALPYYFIWALLQQFLLVYILAEKIIYKRVENRLLASLLAALVFSSLHLPSATLYILTFIAATFWAYAWLKYKKIMPLALSHSVLALMLYHVSPDTILYSAKVFQWFWE